MGRDTKIDERAGQYSKPRCTGLKKKGGEQQQRRMRKKKETPYTVGNIEGEGRAGAGTRGRGLRKEGKCSFETGEGKRKHHSNLEALSGVRPAATTRKGKGSVMARRKKEELRGRNVAVCCAEEKRGRIAGRLSAGGRRIISRKRKKEEAWEDTKTIGKRLTKTSEMRTLDAQAHGKAVMGGAWGGTRPVIEKWLSIISIW